MKRLFKVLLVLILLVILAAFILPFVFKDEIIARAKAEINKSLTAEVDFKDIDISLFRSFPDFSMSIEETTVDGSGQFAGVRLAEIEKFVVDLNLFSVISGSEYELEGIEIENANVHVVIDTAGNANYDIVKASGDTLSMTGDTSVSAFKLTLKEYSIKNLNLVYDDRASDIHARLQNLNHSGSGDFTEKIVDLKTQTTIEELTVAMEGLNYLTKVKSSAAADFSFDQEAFKFTFGENNLKLNDLLLQFSGWLAMPEDDIEMDLSFNAPENQFKNLLSLVPAVYQESFADVQTSGDFLLKGDVKGVYNAENETYPQYDFKFSINEASFRYPDLPAGVDNIDLDAHIYNRSSDLDGTVINIPNASALVAGSPLHARLNLSKPMSNPTFDVYLKTNMDLSNLGQVVPSDDFDYSGKLDADLSLAGNMADIDAERYENVKAEGMLIASEVLLRSDSLPYDVAVSQLNMDFSPQQVKLNAFKSKIGNSDLAANGSISNLMAYALQDKALKADFNLNSNLIDLNELSGEPTHTTTNEKEVIDSAASALEAIRLPENLDLTIKSSVAKLLYDNLEIENLIGTVKIQEGVAKLEGVTMNLLDGSLALSGSYNSVPPQPVVDMNFKINSFSIKESYDKLISIQKLAPIFQNSTGSYSTGFSFNSRLKSDMTPDFSTILANGTLSTRNLQTSPKSLEKLSAILKNQSLSSLSLGNINLSFAVENGRVNVKPFSFKTGNIKAEVSGSNGLDQSLDYTMNLNIPVQGIGAGDLLNKLGATSQGKVDVKVLIGGTFSDPKVTTSLGDIVGNVVDNLKEQAKAKVEEVKQDAINKVNEEAARLIAEAEAKGDQLIAEAQKQADNIMATARAQASKLKTEAYARADKLEADAKGNLLKEQGAKVAANKVRSEADDQAANIVKGARKQADDLLQKARDQKEQLIKEAREKGQLSN